MSHAHNALPDEFIGRLSSIIPQNDIQKAVSSFEEAFPLYIRINTLKTSLEEVCLFLDENHVTYSRIDWYSSALSLTNISVKALTEKSLVKEGKIYIQNISSMVPALILDPKPAESVLDMCAAPGGKTIQMAAIMENKGRILACESVRARYYKLKSIIDKSGAAMIKPLHKDSRRLKGSELFDKIMVDAPCSAEARFKTYEQKSFRYWRKNKIKEMSRKQKQLLLNACKLLKKGGTMVYATCTFAPEENEGVLDWILEKTNHTIALVDIDFNSLESYPSLSGWRTKAFHKAVRKTLRILPTCNQEGFFIAKIKKIDCV